MKWSLALGIAALLGTPGGAGALEKVLQLEVKVVDLECRVLPGTKVTAALLVEHGEMPIEKSAIARSDGRAFIPIPTDRRFTISAELPGFVRSTVGPFAPGSEPVYKVGICLNTPPPQPVTVRSH